MDMIGALLSPWLWAGAGMAGLVAWVFVHFLWPRLRSVDLERELPERLRREGVVLDLHPLEEQDRHPLVRVLAVGHRGGRLLCEVLEDGGAHPLEPGQPLRAEFKPLRLGRTRVNAFFTAYFGEEQASDRIARVLLEPPRGAAFHPRRAQARKKVVDPQFIRAKLWFVSPDSPEGARPADTAPHLAVNDYDVRSGQMSGGSIRNVSQGGLGLELKTALAAGRCAPGAEVIVNLSLFSLKGKAFVSHWYAGVVRSAEEASRESLRVGVQFTRAGAERPDGAVRWARLG